MWKASPCHPNKARWRAVSLRPAVNQTRMRSRSRFLPECTKDIDFRSSGFCPLPQCYPTHRVETKYTVRYQLLTREAAVLSAPRGHQQKIQKKWIFNIVFLPEWCATAEAAPWAAYLLATRRNQIPSPPQGVPVPPTHLCNTQAIDISKFPTGQRQYIM